ncbi:MAG TPA: hypothetical protein VJ501_05500 [Burkholderiaceae bacterium]|nr:hypothetical protein [Burkholderiaceae bacterium]
MRKTLAAAIVGCTIALGGSPAAAAVLCSDITTIAGWSAAGSCQQGDKIWSFGSTSANLSPLTQVIFGGILLTHNMQIVGFDTSDAANTWNIKYDIAVLNPVNLFISDMFAGADNPGGGSLLTKNVTGDPSGMFTLIDVGGAEGPASEKHGLNALLLHIDETFHVDANKNLLSVSNTYLESRRNVVPTPGTLSLLGLGLVAMGAMVRRTRRES